MSLGKHAIYSALLLIVMGFAMPAFADETLVYSDDFEDYDVGGLYNQVYTHPITGATTTWTGNNPNVQIVNSNCYQTGQCVRYFPEISDTDDLNLIVGHMYGDSVPNSYWYLEYKLGFSSTSFAGFKFHNESARVHDISIYPWPSECGSYFFVHNANGNTYCSNFLLSPNSPYIQWVQVQQICNGFTDSCEIFINGISQGATSTPSSYVQNDIVFEITSYLSEDIQVFIDDVYTSTSSSNYSIETTYYGSTGNTSCASCTRVTATDPTQSENVATTTSLEYYVSYFVNSDDYVAGDTYMKLSYQHSLYISYLSNGYSLAHESFTSNIQNGYGTSIFNMGYIYATGTYNVNIEIYSYEDPPWWQFWADPVKTVLANYSTSFYAGTPTSFGQYDEEYRQAEINYLFSHTESPDCDKWNDLDCWYNVIGYKILHGAPIGYATRIFELLTSTSTGSSSLAISLAFLPGTPASDHTLTLDVAGAINTAIATYENPVATFDDTPWDTFMYYWNMVWYLMLALWIVGQIFNVNVLHINSIRRDPYVDQLQSDGTTKRVRKRYT